MFTSNSAVSSKGDWGGLLFLSSEKRNQLENCRIEGAETAIYSQFSTMTAKGVTISNCSSGLVLRDSIATLSAISLIDCTTGVESHDSEIDMRDSAITNNNKGIAAYRSTLIMSSVKVSGSTKEVLLAEECRIRFTSCEFAGNGLGALIKGGEGQVQLSRFVRNGNAGLHLSGARIKLQRCTFADNRGDGMKVDDARSSVWASIFNGNSGYNLANAGREDYSAVQNWWGANDESSIQAKLLGSSKDSSSGTVIVAPWLTEKPVVSQ
ncbi:MAG: right-handed parallel beta-helix repeat-containing protein [Deltaproteobacteria bacterium]